jgi:proteasome assembly chaperone (PAC2) family protein
LHQPSFVAAWPGMGSVAMIAVNYLREQLDAQLIGELENSDFFAPTGAAVLKQIIKPLETPNNRFYAYQSPDGQSDILFFIGSVQPIPHMEYSFANEVLKVAKSFRVKRVYTTAAAPSDMQFKDTPRVFAVPTLSDHLKMLLDYKVHFMGEGTIAGLNGLLLSVATELNMEGICLLGEIPFFTAQVEFPRAAIEVLDILTRLLKLQIDMVDLEIYTNQKEKEIEPLAMLLNKERHEPETPQQIDGIPKEEEKVPKSVRLRIEKLFRQAEFDRTYKSKMRLKEELDKWELFDEYLDRFLDLFKKTQGGS